jgi:hypothetical protein
MFPKWKLPIIIWKLCQVSSRNLPEIENPLHIATRDSGRGSTYQRYNLILPLVEDWSVTA